MIKKISEVQKRKKIPILVGGTGFRAATAASPVAPAAYATAGINAMIVESSDPALAAMCPELTREQRMSWIM